MSVDLDAYFDRIGWQGPARADYATLAGVLAAHMAHVPFENLDVLLGRGVRVDLPSVEAKLVGARRGGYCFEHGTLFAAVLEAIGFAPTRHTARVVQRLPFADAPRIHMFLAVPLPGGTFVVDPGFGALAPDTPLLLDDPAGGGGDARNWMAREGRLVYMRARQDGLVVDCWASSLDLDVPADFALGNYFVSTHPESPFVNRLLLRAISPRGRVSVMNRDATLRGPDGRVQKWSLADRRELRALLAEDFGVDLPEVLDLRVPSIPEWD